MNAYGKHDEVWERYSETIENPNFIESPIMFHKERNYRASPEPRRAPSPIRVDIPRLEENVNYTKQAPDPIMKYPVVQISNQNAEKKKRRGCNKEFVACTTCGVICVVAVLLIVGLVFAFFMIFQPGVYETHVQTDGISLG